MGDVVIYCDMRESRSGIIQKLQEMGAKVQVGELETGDYVVSGDIAVERKTAVDFVASILDGRSSTKQARCVSIFPNRSS